MAVLLGLDRLGVPQIRRLLAAAAAQDTVAVSAPNNVSLAGQRSKRLCWVLEALFRKLDRGRVNPVR